MSKAPIKQGLFPVSEGDLRHWEELSKDLPYTLPKPTEGLEVGVMAEWLERLGFTEKWYGGVTETGLGDFVSLNPRMSLLAFVGLLLEMRDEEKRAGT